MNRPLERAMYKYLKEYKKQICETCKQNFRNKCAVIKLSSGCDLKHLNEKKMCSFISTRLTTMGRKK